MQQLALSEQCDVRIASQEQQLCLRYIDDIFMIWTEGSDNLKIFTDYLNNIHPTIKFTSSHSCTNVPFLDVNVSLNNGNIYTDLYTKPTDKHQRLLFSSYILKKPFLSANPSVYDVSVLLTKHSKLVLPS